MYAPKNTHIWILDDDDLMAKGAQLSQETEKKKKLINQFNYCERAVLTLNNPPRVIQFSLPVTRHLNLLNGYLEKTWVDFSLTIHEFLECWNSNDSTSTIDIRFVCAAVDNLRFICGGFWAKWTWKGQRTKGLFYQMPSINCPVNNRVNYLKM